MQEKRNSYTEGKKKNDSRSSGKQGIQVGAGQVSSAVR